jgi:hypothetical protein
MQFSFNLADDVDERRMPSINLLLLLLEYRSRTTRSFDSSADSGDTRKNMAFWRADGANVDESARIADIER